MALQAWYELHGAVESKARIPGQVSVASVGGSGTWLLGQVSDDLVSDGLVGCFGRRVSEPCARMSEPMSEYLFQDVINGRCADWVIQLIFVVAKPKGPRNFVL